MIHTYPLPRTTSRAHTHEPVAHRAPVRPRASFWNDRQAVRLKAFLIVACLIAAALLEVPW